MAHVIIGLTGDRQVGKSTVADHLVANHGFKRVHPFNGGKAACRGYYMHLGASADEAMRMTDGDLKDVPSRLLPIDPATGDHYHSRFFMEKLGQFMGFQLGTVWTLIPELKRAIEQDPDCRIVLESIVYEVDDLRAIGAKILKVTGDFKTAIVGVETDAAVARIVPDFTLHNAMAGYDDFYRDCDIMLEQNFGIVREGEPELDFAIG